MQDYQQRVVDEKAELDTKLNKLNTFIRTNEQFKKLPRIEQGLLIEQAFYMSAYSGILKDRVSLFNNDEVM